MSTARAIATASLAPGMRVAERFELETPAGVGGMGAVWRARDLHTGEHVALKVLLRPRRDALERFEREAQLLARVRHPAVVRYVAHGHAAQSGVPQYLATAWVEGETLAQRLAREGPLPVAEAITVAQRAAAGLGAAHDVGVIHGDVKPGNLVLAGGRPEGTTVIDFGVAALGTFQSISSERGGGLVGTPAYMAPEQVRADGQVDVRADVFALGGVIFHALTGRAPFVAANLTALLARVLYDEPPPLAQLRPDAPPALAALVARALAKDPLLRPTDGTAMASELAALAARLASATAAATGASLPPALTDTERRLLSVVLAARLRAPGESTSSSSELALAQPPAPPAPGANAADASGEDTAQDTAEVPPAPPPSHDTAPPRDTTAADAAAAPVPSAIAPAGAGPTAPDLAPFALLARIRAATAPYGARVERLANGALIATLTLDAAPAASATDRAAHAARCALVVRALLPGVPVALATGRGELGGGEAAPAGEVIDRAAALLRAPGAAPGDGVRVDDVTAGLLDARFELARVEPAAAPPPDAAAASPPPPRFRLLRAAHDALAAPRTLLGRPSPCVGRDRELRLLTDLFAECASEPVARAAVVIGPPGAGKSRLRFELLRALRAGSPEHPPEVWLGAGDALATGAPFGLLAQALRRAADLLEDAPLGDRRRALATRVARHVPPADQARVTEFLGELVSAPFPDDASAPLRAARADPQLMVDQIRRAWVALLAAECAAHPVVLVLEDLHWSDLATVQAVDAALRALADRPFMVLGFARPEIHARFPAVWSGRGAQEIALRPLGRAASEALVRHFLGDAADGARVGAMLERAGGNALFLEELIRAAVESRADGPGGGGGGGDPAATPATVLAVVSARLERLEPDARRVLRAASVFGEAFPAGGVAALLGGAPHAAAAALEAWLATLTEREVIAPRSEPGRAAAREYVFRHALVRDAAYAMLPDADRALGHRLAADWLAARGDGAEGDAVVLATHYERGSVPARAFAWYHRAAAQALARNDLAGAVELASRAIACAEAAAAAFAPVPAPELGAAHLVRAEACHWRGDAAAAAADAAEAFARAPRGSDAWFDAAYELALATARTGDLARSTAVIAEIVAERAPSTAAGAMGVARLSYVAFDTGQHAMGAQLLARVADAAGDDPALQATVLYARATEAYCSGDTGAYFTLEGALAEALERLGDQRGALMQHANTAHAALELGAYEQAEARLRAAVVEFERIPMRNALATSQANLASALACQGRFDEAREVLRAAIASFEERGNRLASESTYLAAAYVELMAGAPEAALARARALSSGGLTSAHRAYGAALAAIALGRLDQPEAALAEAERSAAELAATGSLPEGDALTRLAYVEALARAGRTDEARAALAAADARLAARAANITDPALRASFLERVPEHARTRALARAWGVAASERA